MNDLDQLRKFAQAMFECSDWPNGGDIDGFAFQDAAVECGLLREEKRTEPCGDIGECFCAEYCGQNDWKDGVACYRKTALLTGEKP